MCIKEKIEASSIKREQACFFIVQYCFAWKPPKLRIPEAENPHSDQHLLSFSEWIQDLVGKVAGDFLGESVRGHLGWSEFAIFRDEAPSDRLIAWVSLQYENGH